MTPIKILAGLVKNNIIESSPSIEGLIKLYNLQEKFDSLEVVRKVIYDWCREISPDCKNRSRSSLLHHEVLNSIRTLQSHLEDEMQPLRLELYASQTAEDERKLELLQEEIRKILAEAKQNKQ